MQNRRPSRRRQNITGDKGPTRQGNTLLIQGETQRRSPRAPHERDESADNQAASEPSGPRMAQAAQEDIERAMMDTGKGPALEETYEKLREETPDPARKLSP